MKKYLLLLFVFLVMVLTSCTANVNTEVTYITNYYLSNGVDDYMDIAALYYADENLYDYDLSAFLNSEIDESSYMDVCGKAIGLQIVEICDYNDRFSDYSPTRYIDLLTKMTTEDDESGFKLPIWERIMGIYAMKLCGHDYPHEKLTAFAEHLLSFQNEDGGFSFTSGESNSDDTACAIPLLIYLRYKKEFADSAANASLYLRKAKNKNDTYSSFGIENSDSTSKALSALMALGFTEKDDDIGDITLALATFRLPNGAYANQQYGKPDNRSCANALIAYCDFNNKNSLWLYILRNEIQ